jgi:hypothetical protein
MYLPTLVSKVRVKLETVLQLLIAGNIAYPVSIIVSLIQFESLSKNQYPPDPEDVPEVLDPWEELDPMPVLRPVDLEPLSLEYSLDEEFPDVPCPEVELSCLFP